MHADAAIHKVTAVPSIQHPTKVNACKNIAYKSMTSTAHMCRLHTEGISARFISAFLPK